MTDSGYNIPSQLRDFQEHHDLPNKFGIDFSPALAGIPLSLLGFWFLSPFMIALGFFVSLTQIFHYWAHFRGPWIVRKLQKMGILISPQAHNHHQSPFKVNYCLVSGWNNFWFNGFTAFVDKLLKTK